MRVWIDLANSPHVVLFGRVVDRFRASGWEVLLTARDHAQTVALARRRWPDVVVVGGESPPGRAAKARSIARRSEQLRRVARHARPDAALSHGSYAQVVAARAAGVPVVTMMDYEYQPANHLSFRLAQRVVVPALFPQEALRRFGAARKAIRYEGFKEELYLAGFEPDPGVLDELGLDPHDVIAVLRPPPGGALYHRHGNPRFAEILRRTLADPGVRAVLLPRTADQVAEYARLDGAVIPRRAVDGSSLLACADLTVGAGGTMNRESALLGTPTYTVFAGRLAAVDAALIRSGRLHDLRADGTFPVLEKRRAPLEPIPASRSLAILDVIERTVAGVV